MKKVDTLIHPATIAWVVLTTAVIGMGVSFALERWVELVTYSVIALFTGVLVVRRDDL